jgi:hypothetical protein
MLHALLHAANRPSSSQNPPTLGPNAQPTPPAVLHYLRARASSSEALYLPADEPTRLALVAEARYYMLVRLTGGRPGLV